MTYSVDLYENTGFNQNNIPDSPVRLGQPFMTKTAIDVIQNRVISSINIKVNNFDEIKNVDYCKLGDFYYIVGSVNMKSHDVATLSLIPDFISSAGGVDNIEFIDGITTRHHVSDDSFGKYIEEDPLLICQRPLKVEYGEKMFNEGSAATSTTIVLSTSNLAEMGKNDEPPAISFKDDFGNEVTVPHLIPVSEPTTFRIGKPVSVGEQIHDTSLTFKINGQQAFILKSKENYEPAEVAKGIQFCRDISAESSIIAQYVVPEPFINFKTLYDLYISLPAGDPVKEILSNFPEEQLKANIAEIRGAVLNRPTSTLPFVFNEDVKNKRVLYGDLCRYGMITSNGNKTEFNPERLLLNQESLDLGIYVAMVSDPRQDGKPYFRFQVIDGSTGVTLYGDGVTEGSYQVNDEYWIGAIPGENWYQLPLVFTSAAGTEISQKYYNQKYSLDKFTQDKTEAIDAANLLTSQISNMGQFISGAFGDVNITKPKVSPHTPVSNFLFGEYTYNEGMNFNQGYNIAAAGINTMVNPMIYGAQKNISDETYKWNVGKNLYELGLSQSVVVPAVTTPISKGTIRDFYGNGVLLYRYRPEDTDLAIQDKLLTMYGYKVTEPLKKEFFNNREYFNYIQLNSASIGGDLPQWFKGGILQQLGNGVRIWHTKPNESYYNNNPIKE